MRNTLKYYENKAAFEPKYGRTYEKYRFEKVFLIRYLPKIRNYHPIHD